MVPVFYLLGAQKCATSSFAEEFASGSNVVLPEMGSWDSFQRMLFSKELHFFDYNDRYGKGQQFWLQHWPTCPAVHMVAAEFTPSYLSAWEAPIRMKQVYGGLAGRLQFLVILREPLARMQSSFYHGLSSKWVSAKYQTFQQYVETALANYHAKAFRYFHDTAGTQVGSDFYGLSGVPWTLSLYHDQLKHWFDYFHPSQFIVAPMQTYTKPEAVPGVTVRRDLLAKVGSRSHIGIANMHRKPKKDPPRRNVHSHPEVEQDLTPETRSQINGVFNLLTGPAKLAQLLSPAMQKGLVLYGYGGYLANPQMGRMERIAAYIRNNW